MSIAVSEKLPPRTGSSFSSLKRFVVHYRVPECLNKAEPSDASAYGNESEINDARLKLGACMKQNRRYEVVRRAERQSGAEPFSISS